jgi:hypothetical protein
LLKRANGLSTAVFKNTLDVAVGIMGNIFQFLYCNRLIIMFFDKIDYAVNAI